MSDTPVRRGEIYWARLDPSHHADSLRRPVLIVQNDIGNALSPTVIVAAITTDTRAGRYPFGHALERGTLPEPAAVNCAHLRTIETERLEGGPVAKLDTFSMHGVDIALMESLGLPRGPFT